MKRHTEKYRNQPFRKVYIEQLETRTLMAAVPTLIGHFQPTLAAAIGPSIAGTTVAASQGTTTSSTSTPAYTLTQTLSDQAQLTTLAFDGLAIMTGNLDSQSFFPPGKVADYFGFQYLRDNDPDNMGHNTSFLTRVANDIIYSLSDSQFAQLKTLAVAQQSQVALYAYERYPLMEAFNRLVNGNTPPGSSGLSLTAVENASAQLYTLDGQISFDRATLYASIINSLSSTQKTYWDAMKGVGFNSWPVVTDSQIQSRMQSLPQGTAELVMTYASDMFSWYAGSVTSEVYFCPERHGTYFGGFYIKDAPAVGHEGYSISEQLTATAGAALCDASQGYVTQSQAAMFDSLLNLQRNNLYAGATNIVQVRTQISTLLRSLRTSTANSASVKTQVLALSATYGNLDGQDNYNYATVFAQVYKTLTTDQKTKLTALRKSIMSGTYSDGTPFDYSTCTTPFLYSDTITDTSVLAPYISNTDSFFTTSTAPQIQVFAGTTAITNGTGSVAFGSTPLGTPISQTFTVKNTGTANLTLTTPITVPSGFTLVSSFGANTLAPGASTTFVVKLNATAGGTFSGKVSFSDNDSTAATFGFTITGTVTTAPKIQVLSGTATIANAATVAFGSTPLGTPISKTFTVKNTGTANLTLTGPIAIPAGFSVTTTFGSTNLAPGASTTFVVRLDAKTAGNYSGAVSFGDNDATASKYSFAVSGTVTAPKIQALQGTTVISAGMGSFAFGSTSVGTSITKIFTVTNTGTANLVLTAPITVPAGFTVVSSFGSTTLAPGASTTFVIKLNATAAGTYSGTL